MTLIGYTDHPSFLPGQDVPLRISGTRGQITIEVVRLRHGDTSSNGPGLVTEQQPSLATVTAAIAEQTIRTGSYLRVPADRLGGTAWTFTLWIYPTMGSERDVCVADFGPMQLMIAADKRLHLSGSTVVTSDAAGPPIRLHRWQLVALAIDAVTGTAHLSCLDTQLGPSCQAVPVDSPESLIQPGRDLLIAAQDTPAGASHHFTGKIEEPVLWSRCLSTAELTGVLNNVAPPLAQRVAVWDFAQAPSGWRAIELSQAAHGLLVNAPTRAVTGRRWKGEVDDWRQGPEQYGAIHFHADDLADARWNQSAVVQLPSELPNGVYAAHLRHHDSADEDWIPFVVAPAAGSEVAELAVLLPTFTYLAYANEPIFDPHVPLCRDHRDDYVRDSGLLSLYNFHADGSGVTHASWRKPMTNLRPDYRYWLTAHPHGLAADLYLLHWLDDQQIPYTVITDHDVHQHGAELLSRFQAVITGAHPEYWTRPGVTAMTTYLDGGGRLIYLGGNGFAALIGVNPQTPDLIELRRRLNGPGLWDAEPGELHLSSTGERGGFLRHSKPRSREITGVEICGMGFADARPYRRGRSATDPRAAFVLDGVTSEHIGAHGLHMGAAAGYEVDSADYAAGTPEHALVLASATGFPTYQDTDQRGVKRADMLFFETPAGGAVFSVGSITWSGSLSTNRGDNDVSRITRNVIDRFLKPEPFPWPAR